MSRCPVFARVALLLVCVAALGPARADAQSAAREGAAQTPAVSSPSTRADTPDAAPAAAPSPRPAPAAARKSISTTLAVVEQPRAIGYFVGDKIVQRVLLERDGHAVAPVALPTPGRVSAWFERRSASVETDASSRHWLAIQYQILNAPPKLITVKLPAWTLALKGDATPTTAALRIPEALVNVAPLSPPGSPTQVGNADLRADHSPPAIATSPIRRAIALSTGAFVLTLIAWLAWVVWRNRRARATQPFASALREMRAFDDREPRAWQALHRAFDRTAGRVIQSATLPTLFERAPQLLPARGEIEQFFAQSSLLFFGTARTPGSAPASALSTPTAPTSASSAAGAPSPRGLCLELRRIEKRHEQ
jgi:mxaA protein